MVKLYDTSGFGYIEVEVEQFYSNDLPIFFAKTGKDTYLRDFEAPIYTVPNIIHGNVPVDGGYLLLSAEEKNELVVKNPASEKWIRPFVGAREFINKIPRYCLWLEDCPPNELKRMPLVYERVENVREFRLASKKELTRRRADTSWLFAERRQPTTNYLLIPRHSSGRREYIPIGYMDANVICGDANQMIPDAKYFHFGVLTSLPHMAWTRLTCGRLRNDYRYSVDVVYNNFPWPPFWREVERTAAKILATRKKYPDASLADLYDPLLMPKDLRRAHEENDRAVMAAYDFPKNMSELEMQRAFLRMYDNLKNIWEILYK